MRRCHAAHGDRREVSVAQIALAWLLTKPFVSSVIIGAKSMEQLRDNMASTSVELPGGAQIARRSEPIPPEYPGWMLDLQGQPRQGAGQGLISRKRRATPQLLSREYDMRIRGTNPAIMVLSLKCSNK